jgi:hypothetical protein
VDVSVLQYSSLCRYCTYGICSTEAFAVSGRVCSLHQPVLSLVLPGRVFPSAACDPLDMSGFSLYCPWTCLFYSSLGCFWTYLFYSRLCCLGLPTTFYATFGRVCPQQPLLTLDVVVRQQTVQPFAPCMFCSSLYSHWTCCPWPCLCVCSPASCTLPGGV